MGKKWQLGAGFIALLFTVILAFHSFTPTHPLMFALSLRLTLYVFTRGSTMYTLDMKRLHTHKYLHQLKRQNVPCHMIRWTNSKTGIRACVWFFFHSLVRLSSIFFSPLAREYIQSLPWKFYFLRFFSLLLSNKKKNELLRAPMHSTNKNITDKNNIQNETAREWEKQKKERERKKLIIFHRDDDDTAVVVSSSPSSFLSFSADFSHYYTLRKYI